MIGTMATFAFRVLRRASVLLEDTPAAASIPLSTTECPEAPAFAEFTIRGSTALDGTITVTGELDGSPQSEVVQVGGAVGASGMVVVRTCKRFDCFTAIDTTGLADEVPVPTVRADIIGSGGEAVHAVTELAACVMGHREDPLPNWRGRTPGGNEESFATIDYDDWYDFEPRPGDLWVEERNGVEATTWEVVGEPRYLGDMGAHHWELRVRKANARSTTVTTP